MAIEDQSDEQIVRRCCDAPGAEVWSEFVRRFSPVIAVGVLRALGKCTAPDQVEEHVQSTLANLCERQYHALRLVNGLPPAAIRSYVRTMGANEAISAFRSRKYEVSMDGEDPGTTPRPDREILLRQVFDHLRRCTGENAQRDRLIFELYYRTGLTAIAISRTPGIELTQKGVETRLLRMIDCLRRHLTPGPRGLMPGGAR